MPFVDLLEEIYNYEDYGCIHNEVTADVYLGDCVDLDSNVCYDTIPLTPTCQCIGDLDQYDCAMLAILNKHAGNQLRG